MNYNYYQQPIYNDTPNSMIAVFVNGDAGANAYPVASGNTVLLMDFNSNKFWLKSNPQGLRTFTFTEEVKQPEIHESVTRDEFNNLSKSVSALADNVNKLLQELGGATGEQ